MAIAIGTAAGQALAAMVGVRRVAARAGSLEAGSFEADFFLAPARGETDRLLHVARRTLDAARRLRRDARAGVRQLSAAERTIARLSASAVRVYEELLTLGRLNAGRIHPSYDYLAAATGLGRATVGRAIAILEAIGFLIRRRRFVRIAGQGAGPRYEQTSNAYRALLPAQVLGYLPRWMRPAPPPADVAWDERERRRAGQAMLATLSCRDLGQTLATGALGRMLASLGAAVDRREREDQIDPGTSSNFCLSGSPGGSVR